MAQNIRAPLAHKGLRALFLGYLKGFPEEIEFEVMKDSRSCTGGTGGEVGGMGRRGGGGGEVGVRGGGGNRGLQTAGIGSPRRP